MSIITKRDGHHRDARWIDGSAISSRDSQGSGRRARGGRRGEPSPRCVCGGAALNALGFVERPTLDVDVVALMGAHADGGKFLTSANPLPPKLVTAAMRLASNLDLGERWLNAGPTDLLRFGLPEGYETRLVTRRYGRSLTVSFLGQFDLVCLKLYALADTGPGKHEQDLRALAVPAEELEEAA